MVSFGKVSRYPLRDNSVLPRLKETRANRRSRDREETASLLSEAAPSNHSDPARQQPPASIRRVEGRPAASDSQDCHETAEFPPLSEYHQPTRDQGSHQLNETRVRVHLRIGTRTGGGRAASESRRDDRHN